MTLIMAIYRDPKVSIDVGVSQRKQNILLHFHYYIFARMLAGSLNHCTNINKYCNGHYCGFVLLEHVQIGSLLDTCEFQAAWNNLGCI